VDAIMAIVEEELGIWRDPATRRTEPTIKEKPIDPADQKIEKERGRLAGAEHQGRLDRIAVAISVLKRFILKHPGDQYAPLRFAAITRQLSPLIKNKALARWIDEYLRVNNREVL